VSGNSFNHPVGRVCPEGMSSAFAFEVTPVAAQVLEQAVALHGTATVS
jgi:hypothetical protein